MSQAQSPSAPFDPTRWPNIFILLSMDVVTAFADLMGLPTASPGALRDVLRSEIQRVRRKLAEAPPEERTFSPDEVLDVVARRLGELQRKALVWWAAHVFEVSTRDHLALWSWLDVLRRCKDDPERWRRLALPDEVRAEVRTALEEALDPTTYQERRARVEAERLSDWDLHMYVLHMFDDEDDVLPTGPYRYLYPTVAVERGYAFWAWLLQRLDEPARRALLRSATKIVEQTPELQYVGTLAEPASMEVRFDVR